MMLYRTATTADAPALVELLKVLGYEVSRESVTQRLMSIRSQGGEVIVAEDAGQVVGCVQALVDTRLAEGQAGEIVSLVVFDSYRGHGVGTALLHTARSWLAERNCKALRIRANAIRTEAHRLYRAQGFQEVKTQKIFKQEIGD
ncbi:MAG: GNAT family N-acetyltransferase [Anaerolineae bacterium]|nr:GNAT family N-acetyltransferase [Anaerolineae bacterium]